MYTLDEPQECEECRIYTPTFTDDDVTGNCSVRCPREYNVTTLCSEGYGERDSTNDAYAKDNLHYGQVMYTQFIGMDYNVALEDDGSVSSKNDLVYNAKLWVHASP